MQQATDCRAYTPGPASDENHAILHSKVFRVGKRRDCLALCAAVASAGKAEHQRRLIYGLTSPRSVYSGILRYPAQSNFLATFPLTPDLVPDQEAIAHSARLADRIDRAIRGSGGWIGFDRFMEMALYEPGLGYYSGGSTKFGAAGDFVTAPEMSPLFGRTLAHQISDILAQTTGDVLELGPGTGALASQVLLELEHLDRLPRRYLLLDVSGELRARQQALLRQIVPHLADRVVWLDALEPRITGVVIANEVLDAVPAKRVAWMASGCVEIGVTAGEDGFAWSVGPRVEDLLAKAVGDPPVEVPFLTEIGLEAAALVATLADRLERGALILVDYGFGKTEYRHPQRSAGTLMCHYRHHAHADPFLWPGLQDITAHVDFTAMAAAGLSCGLVLSGYTTQAHFLVNCGITDLLLECSPDAGREYLQRASAVQKLLSPNEMGELFKVLALTRGLPAPLRGFAHGDLRRLL